MKIKKNKTKKQAKTKNKINIDEDASN